MSFTIRTERATDVDAIAHLTEAAFQKEDHSSRTEHFIVNALRRRGKLTISLVAIEGDTIIGHVALSPITISDGTTEWYGLGPISVLPERQGKGIGSQLMQAALAQLQSQGAQGCVVLGNPTYYGRFGFKTYVDLVFPGVPPQYFQAVCFRGEFPRGNVSYDKAFGAQE